MQIYYFKENILNELHSGTNSFSQIVFERPISRDFSHETRGKCKTNAIHLKQKKKTFNIQRLVSNCLATVSFLH